MAMIEDPSAIFAILVSVVGGVAWLSSRPRLKRFFNVVPGVLFVYFIPTLLTTVGVLPAESALYSWAKMNLMPMSLLLLVITIDIPAILRLGPKMIFVMLAGALGVILGGPIVMYFFRDQLPVDAWKGLAALCGSWTGGVGNFAAIAASLEAPTNVVSPAVIVDTVVGYGWMAVILFLSAYQKQFNKWIKADDTLMHEVKERLVKFHHQVERMPRLSDTLLILGIGFGGGYLLFNVGGNLLPVVGKTLSHGMWGIILLMAGGIALSFTPLRRLDGVGAGRIGNAGLFLLLATIGAGGNLRSIASTPVYLIAGAAWLVIHVVFTLVATRMVRAPLFYAAVGSQANIGGSISCPIAAEAYQEHMAPAGLLMALLGTLIGTYAGMICGFMMEWVQGSHGIPW